MKKSDVLIEVDVATVQKLLPRALRAARLEVDGYAPFTLEDLYDNQSGERFDFTATLEPESGGGKAAAIVGLHFELKSEGENTRVSCECSTQGDGAEQIEDEVLNRALTVLSTTLT